MSETTHPPAGGLTRQEQEIMISLIEAWNNFVKLPVLHPDDNGEFRHHLHALQNSLASRVVFREHDDYWRVR